MVYACQKENNKFGEYKGNFTCSENAVTDAFLSVKRVLLANAGSEAEY